MFAINKGNYSIYSLLSIIGLILMLLLNTLAVTLPLNGYETGALSDLYPNLFVPVGLTFSIWGVLYLCLTGFVICSILIDGGHTNRHERVLKRITPLFFASCVLNATWIVFWHYLQLSLSVMVMAALLLTLILLYDRLREIRYGTLVEEFFMKGTISLYLGWISVAFIANLSAYWVSFKPSSYLLSEVTWTIIVIAAAVFLAVYFSAVKQDVLYSLVIVWALYGIYLKHMGFWNNQYPSILLALKVGLAVSVASIVYRLLKKLMGK